MEHKALKHLFWGILLAMLAQPLSFLGGVNLKIQNMYPVIAGGDWPVKVIFLLTAVGLVIIGISLKKLVKMSEAFDAVRWIAVANAIIAFILALGKREVIVYRNSGQINRHDWFPLDIFHYLVTIALLIIMCKLIVEWCVANGLDEMGGGIIEMQNRYLVYFVVSMFLFSLGTLFPGFFVIIRWVLIPVGLFLVYSLASAISNISGQFEPEEEF
jgi:hypothetical protein